MKAEFTTPMSNRRRDLVRLWVFVVLSGCASSCDAIQDFGTEFFESRIRPVLIENCYSCHNSVDQSEAGFALDWRTGIRADSEHGTGVVPGKPGDSLLLKVIEHQVEGLEMPEGGAQLSPEVIADFRKWIADGASDPRDQPPSENELKQSISWESTLESRKKWWSFQPVRNPVVPPVNDWSDHPIDRFVFRAAQLKSLEQSQPAENRVLARRLAFALTGLPPSPGLLAEVESGAKTIEALVDELLASPQFGERWARHWMDLVRYADSHGSEGDPAIPNAFQYRDYLIRAFNADVSYQQLVREHIAGDLMANPRINEPLGINESMIGPAYWRLCFHGFAPTDALDEKVRFTDDQINVFGKAFLGLTISCARCHNHKFDAISQSDYYALFGVIGSCRPAMKDANTRRRQVQHEVELGEIKNGIKSQLAQAWLNHADRIADRLLAPDETMKAMLVSADAPTHSLHVWKTLLAEIEKQNDFKSAWQAQERQWSVQQTSQSDQRNEAVHDWDLASQTDFEAWFGEGSESFAPVVAGEFTLANDGNQIVSAIYPAGVFTNLISDRHRGVLGSPRFHVDEKWTAWMRCVGGGQATARYVVQNYPRNGTVYPINEVKNRNWHWQRFDLDYWQGDDVHLEIATARDAPLQTRDSDRSWFGVRDVVIRKSELGPPSDFPMEFLTPVFAAANAREPTSIQELAERFAVATADAVKAWRDGKLTNPQALFLDALIRDAVLPNTMETLRDVREPVQRYRNTELAVPLPFRVPGVAEADSFDQPLLERGDHHKPLEPVPRRFLEAIDATSYQTGQSGRWELANDLFRADNPLTSRVIVNRIWLYLFGRGLVATPDNFGRLGAKPSHPELLDFLATRMVEQNWSIKDMIRFIVDSKTWQQSSVASPRAREIDPENNLLTHFSLQRLDAESIRDSLVSVSGGLSIEMYGPGFLPDSQSNRRAVYVRSNRNTLDKFLVAFDSPVPFATTGQRNATNVPAQSLALLNSPFVIERSKKWAERMRNEMPAASGGERINAMFETAVGRKPDHHELAALADYLNFSEEVQRNRMDQQNEMQRSLISAKNELATILDPVRTRMIEARTKSGTAEQDFPLPLARWDFSQGLTDTMAGLKLTLKSSARIENNALILDGDGFAISDPLAKPMAAKTLEAWVQLDGLKQKGGGIVTLQDLAGNVFDSIVFGELETRHWLSGSNFHLRTLPFGGAAEKSAKNEPVHVAITYAADGTITGYRNGEPYGKAIRKSDLQTFPQQQSQIVLGIRHGIKTTPGRMLIGKIHEVRVYDRALSREQIAASFSGQPVISDANVLAELSPDQRDSVFRLRDLVANGEQELHPSGSSSGPHDPLARVAHAIFNLKEFIYIR